MIPLNGMYQDMDRYVVIELLMTNLKTPNPSGGFRGSVVIAFGFQTGL